MARLNTPPILVKCPVCRTEFSKPPSTHWVTCSSACAAQHRRDYERKRNRNRNRHIRVTRRAPSAQASMIERYTTRTDKRNIERALAKERQAAIDKLMKEPLIAV